MGRPCAADGSGHGRRGCLHRSGLLFGAPSNGSATDTDTPATVPPAAAPTPVPATSLLGLLALSSSMGLAGVGGFFRRRS